MLTIKSLTLKNIGRFVTEQTVKFDELGNLVQVDGENRNTGGSSASGKSTFFNASEYNLGLNDIPTTVIQSRLSKEGIYTVGHYDWDGKEVELIRGKGKLAITIDGNLTEGSNKLVEEKIDEMLGMSRDLFRPIFHKRQKEGGFFLAMTPSKVHEFLTNCLGLSDFKTKLDLADKKFKELSAVKLTVESELSQARAGLSATQNAVLGLGLEPVQDMHAEVVERLKVKYAASQSEAILVTDNHKKQMAILEGQRPELLPSPVLSGAIELPIPTLETSNSVTPDVIEGLRSLTSELQQEINKLASDDAERIKKVTQAIEDRKLAIQALSQQCRTAVSAKDEAIAITGHIKKVRDAICPTCEQNWVTETAKIKESEYLAKLNGLRLLITDGVTAETALTKTNMEIGVLMRELNPKNAELIDKKKVQISETNRELTGLIAEEAIYQNELRARNKTILENHAEQQREANRQISARNAAAIAKVTSQNRDLMDAYAKMMNLARNSHEQQLTQVVGQAELDHNVYVTAKNKLEMFESAKKAYDSSAKNLKAQETTYLFQTEAKQASLTKSEKELAFAEEAKRAIKSFMSCSFDDALDEIGDKATDIIRSVPTMVNVTIRLEGLRETQAGKIKEEVNAVMSMDGDENVDIRSLSGGERSAADLAIDLAVIDLIENRSNKGVSVFILDEPFVGLGPTEIEPILEMLKALKINKKLIIVEHNAEVKEMVESRLVVVREGLYSNIIQ